ncbi:hypothetical protein BD769DRAFT_1390856 [Suillus cothurnatus]|nr:hypothetical protein BD769DRAFT_1390856 [Suillus cothurnatus]
MVKSKQTCKKSTGGTAPRVTLKLPVPTAVPAAQEVAVCEPLQHNEYCIVCRDGSVGEERLFLCSLCPRAMCSHCMVIPSAGARMIEADDVTFICISCHIGRERHGRVSYTPYCGFYRRDKAVFSPFLPICATLEVSLKSELSSAPLLMIHLILVDHDTASSCFDLACDFLRPYFPTGGFEVCTIAFDIGNALKVESYQSKASAIVQALKSSWMRIVIAITNHTDNDRGDPFVGYEGKKKVYVSAHIHSVLDILLSPWHRLIDGAEESYLWLFSCGALINNPTSFACLQQAVINHHMTATIAFNAVRFQPSFATHLLLAFAELVLIERLSIQLVFPDMVGQSYKLGRHTDVFLLMPVAPNSLTVTKYSWTDSQLRPWGQYLPVQCPDCGWANAWEAVSKCKQYSFECKNPSCRKEYLFSQPANSRILMPGKRPGACWIAITLEPTPGIPDEDEMHDDLLDFS